jgi:hypothetical protein
MLAVVVYESMYGNTHTVAERIGAGLAPVGEVVVVPVGEATDDLVASADLLVVGGPTHVHGMSRSATRQEAVENVEEQGEDLEVDPDAEGPGLRDWFKDLREGHHCPAAAFDTRVGTMSAVLSGRASKGIHRRLRHHGFTEVVEPESFLIDADTHLMDGEEDRAVEWGATIAASLPRAD